MSDDDWRLRGQEEYLTGVALARLDWSAPPPGRAWRLDDGTVMQSRSPEAAPPSRAVEEVTPQQWDHDHCEFCWATLADSSAGYTPAPPDERFGRVWVCSECFEDFRVRFGWTVVEP